MDASPLLAASCSGFWAPMQLLVISATATVRRCQRYVFMSFVPVWVRPSVQDVVSVTCVYGSLCIDQFHQTVSGAFWDYELIRF